MATIRWIVSVISLIVPLLPVFQRVEQREREEEAAGAKIAVKKKKGKGKSSGRQAKLTSDGAELSSNSLKITRPSPFAETIEPTIPEFNSQPKKPSAGGRRAKKEPNASSEVKVEAGNPPKSTGKTPEKVAAAKSVKEAFGLDDDEKPPSSLMERIAAKKPTKQSTIRFPKAPAAKRSKKADKEVVELDESDEEEDIEEFMDYDTPPPSRQMPTRKKVRTGLSKSCNGVRI